MENKPLAKTIIKGIIGGAFVGLLIGRYISNASAHYIFYFAHSVSYIIRQYAQSQYVTTVTLSYALIFAAIGPYIAFGTFGPWVRDAVYGFLKALLLLVIITFILAGLFKQHSMYLFSFKIWSFYIGNIGVPVAFIFGPPLGIEMGGNKKERPQFRQNIVKGAIGGALFGLLAGCCLAISAEYYMLLDSGFKTSAFSLLNKNVRWRYFWTITFSLGFIFTLLGPYIISGQYSSKVRHAFFGILGSMFVVTLLTLIAAKILDQQPFNMYKGSEATCIDFSRMYLIPTTLFIGPLIGILVGRKYEARKCEIDPA